MTWMHLNSHPPQEPRARAPRYWSFVFAVAFVLFLASFTGLATYYYADYYPQVMYPVAQAQDLLGIAGDQSVNLTYDLSTINQSHALLLPYHGSYEWPWGQRGSNFDLLKAQITAFVAAVPGWVYLYVHGANGSRCIVGAACAQPYLTWINTFYWPGLQGLQSFLQQCANALLSTEFWSLTQPMVFVSAIITGAAMGLRFCVCTEYRWGWTDGYGNEWHYLSFFWYANEGEEVQTPAQGEGLYGDRV